LHSELQVSDLLFLVLVIKSCPHTIHGLLYFLVPMSGSHCLEQYFLYLYFECSRFESHVRQYFVMNKKETLKEYNQLRRESKKAEREILDLQRGVYNKPMAIEMQKEYALMAYINSEDAVAASVSCGIPVSIVRKWIKAENWDAIKREHYQKVRMKTVEVLDTTVAEQKAKLGSAVAEKAMDLISRHVDDSEMTVIEQARATKDLIDSYIKLTGDSVDVREQDKIEGVSEKTQQIFFNLFQDNRNVESSDGVILDDVSEIELIQELENDEE